MIMAAADGSAAALSGNAPVWEVLVPGMAFAIVFALGAARFWPARRTRKIAYALAVAGALIGLASIALGLERWAS